MEKLKKNEEELEKFINENNKLKQQIKIINEKYDIYKIKNEQRILKQ
jgi:hypothetical protein